MKYIRPLVYARGSVKLPRPAGFTFAIMTLLLCAAPLSAQRQKAVMNISTPEGQKLQKIGQETDEPKKTAMMEQFVAEHPQAEALIRATERRRPPMGRPSPSAHIAPRVSASASSFRR